MTWIIEKNGLGLSCYGDVQGIEFMSGVIKSLISQLLVCADAGSAKPVVDKLVRELCQITGLDLHPEFFQDERASLTSNGKAVSPTTAAQCAEDVERTRVFLQGIYAALQDCLVQTPVSQKVRVLYAGTGPFGLLLAPLLPLLDQSRFQITLLDIHEESLAKMQQLLTHLEIIPECVCLVHADACQWHTEQQFELIISETMRQGLIQEPQVSVFAHLHQFLVPGGLLIPELVRLDMWLTRFGQLALEGVANEEPPLHLGTVLQLNKLFVGALGSGDKTVLSGCLPIPSYPHRLSDLKLTTYIVVYRDYQLTENQSQLTLPLYEKNAHPVPGTQLKYRYDMGDFPRCVFEYEQLPEFALEKLPGSLEANAQGLYHVNRLWQKAQWQKRNGSKRVATLAEDEWLLDRILIDSLGLGLEPTVIHLYRCNEQWEFEQWMLSSLRDFLTPEKIAQINGNIVSFLHQGEAPQKFPSSQPLTPEQVAFWDEYGYLIVPAVLSEAECVSARAAIWNFLGMSELDPASWYLPSTQMQKIMVQLFSHTALDVARQSEYIRRVFEQLWQRNDLVVSTDRVGFNPPETSLWKFPGPSIHWDVELKAPIPFATQGLIYLTDVSEEQGAFCCVPGFHKKIDQWLSELPSDIDPADQDWQQWPVKPIAAKAGDLIVWHQALPHGSSPNRANYPRMVQYLNMYT